MWLNVEKRGFVRLICEQLIVTMKEGEMGLLFRRWEEEMRIERRSAFYGVLEWLEPRTVVALLREDLECAVWCL